MQVLTTTKFNILSGFGGIAGARWWLVGAEDGMTRAVTNMRHVRSLPDDRDYRLFAHRKLRLGRRELRKAMIEYDARRALGGS